MKSILSHLHFRPATEGAIDNDQSVTTRIGSATYRISSDDNYLDHIKGEFEPDIVRLFSSLLRDGQLVFDVGANIGCTSLLFGQQARRVYSFEPSPTTFRFLEKNIHASGLDNIRPVNMGLGKENGFYELTFSADNRSGGFVSNQTQASAGHQVEKIRIVRGDEFVRQERIDGIGFIKIDVEGFEQSVLQGLRETIARFRPVVALELNHWCLNVFQRTSVPDFLDFLRGIFPLLYAVDQADARNLHDVNAAYHVMYHHVVGNFKYPNLVGAFDKAQLAAFAEAFRIDI